MAVALKVFTKDKPLFSRLKNMEPAALREVPVETVPFTPRALAGMSRAGIITLGDLEGKTRLDLLKIRGLGLKAAAQVEFYMGELGLKLRTSNQPAPEPARPTTVRERELEIALRQAQATLKRLTEVLG